MTTVTIPVTIMKWLEMKMIVNRTITPPSETPSPISSTIQLTTKRPALATAPAATREHTRRFASACVQASIHIKKKKRMQFSTSVPPSCSCSTCQQTYSHTTISDNTFRQCEIIMYSFYLALTSLFRVFKCSKFGQILYIKSY